MRRTFFIFIMFALLLSACAAGGPTPTPTIFVETVEPPTITVPPADTATPPPAADTEAPIETATSEPAGDQPALPDALLGYLGNDGNIYLVNTQDGEPQQLTEDGAALSDPVGDDARIRYKEIAWSPNGRYLSYIREVSTPEGDALAVNESLWVYDTEIQEHLTVLQDLQFAGYDWQPGTESLTYALRPPQDYFTGEIGSNSSLASGIFSISIGAEESQEIVAPQEGFSLVGPRWSPQGTYLAFEEIVYIEGRGNFAYYEPGSQTYTRWERPIGNYAFSPDETILAYDNLNYRASGDERIFLNNLQGDDERVFSDVEMDGVAIFPRFSPDGAMISYHVGSVNIEEQLNHLFVQPLDGEARDLGAYVQIANETWAPDGIWIAADAGEFGNKQVLLIDAVNVDATMLVEGWQVVWQP